MSPDAEALTGYISHRIEAAQRRRTQFPDLWDVITREIATLRDVMAFSDSYQLVAGRGKRPGRPTARLADITRQAR